MNKMIFKSTHEGETCLTYETNALCLDEIVDEFAMFLRGCGYQLDGLEPVYNETEAQENLRLSGN